MANLLFFYSCYVQLNAILSFLELCGEAGPKKKGKKKKLSGKFSDEQTKNLSLLVVIVVDTKAVRRTNDYVCRIPSTYVFC